MLVLAEIPLRESAVKKPGWLEEDDAEGRPNKEGGVEERAVLELPKEEPPKEGLPVDKVAPVPPVPTLVSRGKAGADMVELSPNELLELPAPFGETDIPPRLPEAPGEVVVWALIAARRGPSELVWAKAVVETTVISTAAKMNLTISSSHSCKQPRGIARGGSIGKQAEEGQGGKEC
ncbi:MAG: hypothetical protein ACKVP0_13975 [Pirellulaceae bacterium]